jgi:hypothetical protein
MRAKMPRRARTSAVLGAFLCVSLGACASPAGREHGPSFDAPATSPAPGASAAPTPTTSASTPTAAPRDAGGTDSAANAAGTTTPTSAEQILFDGTSIAAWKMAGRGSFSFTNGTLVAQPGDDLGLYWCTIPTPPDFVLSLEWMRGADDDNSGVFVRFPDPDSKGYDNTAWVGVHFGFEIQIDERGEPDGASIHKTGAIYTEQGQMEPRKDAKPVGEWNTYEIRVVGTSYAVTLNGTLVTTWSYTGDPDPMHPGRGLPSTPTEPRYIGFQSHTGHVAFRNVRIRAL